MKSLLILLMLATPAAAKDVKIRTGDHPGFTRVVIEDPDIRSWQIGSIAGGYALQVGPGGRSFDLTDVYRVIGHRRLASIKVDETTEQLHLGLGCVCHVEAEEIRPGVIVIDLADGPPTLGSEFEMPLTTQAAPVRPKIRPPTTRIGYDWTDPGPRLSLVQENPRQVPEIALSVEDPAMMAMRQLLLEQISRGAANGSVEIVKPQVSPAVPASRSPPPSPRLPGQVKVGGAPGYDAAATQRIPDQLTASGSDCVGDDRLDIGSWGSDRPVPEHMAIALTGLTGEFDSPDAEAVIRGAQYYLYLGFGAESRQMLDVFSIDDPGRPLWESIGRILDGEAVSDGPLKGMEVCDTAAALWAMLGQPAEAIAKPHLAAVLRTFSGLPLHLRRHLGPRLAEIFLARNDPESARSVRDAVMRAHGPAGPRVQLMDATLEIAEGNAEKGELALTSLATGAGPAGPEALVALVEHQLSTGADVSEETVTALAGFLHEARGTPPEPKLAAAYRLSLAATGDYERAFAFKGAPPESEIRLWSILAERGSDAALLAFGILPEQDQQSRMTQDTRRKLARRLFDLGFADPAKRWIEATGKTEAEDRLLASEFALKRGDAHGAMRELAGLGGKQADELRAAAAFQLGDKSTDAGSSAASGDLAGELQGAFAAGNWAGLASSDGEAWRNVAALAVPKTPAKTSAPTAASASVPDEGSAGPLARSRVALAESEAARQKIRQLLDGFAPERSAP